MFYSFPGSVLQCLLLIVPAYKMAGTHPEETDMTFYLYMGTPARDYLETD